MAENGIRTTNLVLDDSNPAVEVLVHAAIGSEAIIRRQSLGVFIARIITLATNGSPDAPAVLATLLARGFTLGADGNLHLTQVEADLVAEIVRAKAAEIPGIRADGLRQQKFSVPRAIKSIFPEGITPRAYGPSNFLEWTVGMAMPRDVPNPDTVTFWLQFLDLAETLAIKFYARPGSAPWGSDGSVFIWPGVFGQDRLLCEGTYRVADLATLSPGTLATPIHFPIRDAGPLDTMTWYYPVISAKNKAGQPIGVAVSRGRDRYADNVEPAYRGGILRDANGNVIAPQDRGMVAYSLNERRFIEGFHSGSDARQTIDRAAAPKRIQSEKTGDGQSFFVRLPEMQIANSPDPIIISDATGTAFAGTDVPPVSSVTGEATTLVANYDQPLLHRHIDNVVVRAGGAALAEGTHYKLNRPLGLIQGLQAVADRAITVDYTWAPDRYDTVVANPANGTFLVQKGTNRNYAPNNFLPNTDGFLPLFNVYVTRNAIELIPVHEFDGFVRRGEEGRYAAWIGRNKRCLRKIFALLQAGQPIRLGGYGDSITAMSGGGADPYTPNGNRDQVAFFTGSGYPQAGFPLDVLNLYPRYASNPFGAQDANGPFLRMGWLWALKDLFERRYGSITEVRNWGVPGTSSAYDLGGSGPNAGYPDRINAYMADKCDLTIFAFGMNERGYFDSIGNIRPQIRAIQASGSEVMVVTCPRPNRARGSEPDDWWLSTTRQYRQAAIETDAAYVDLSEISGPGNEGGLGISGSTMCEQNLGNHPGPYEYQKYNAFICETFAR